MYVCKHIYIHVYIFIRSFIHAFIHMHMHTYVCTCASADPRPHALRRAHARHLQHEQLYQRRVDRGRGHRALDHPLQAALPEGAMAVFICICANFGVGFQAPSLIHSNLYLYVLIVLPTSRRLLKNCNVLAPSTQLGSSRALLGSLNRYG